MGRYVLLNHVAIWILHILCGIFLSIVGIFISLRCANKGFLIGKHADKFIRMIALSLIIIGLGAIITHSYLWVKFPDKQYDMGVSGTQLYIGHILLGIVLCSIGFISLVRKLGHTSDIILGTLLCCIGTLQFGYHAHLLWLYEFESDSGTSGGGGDDDDVDITFTPGIEPGIEKFTVTSTIPNNSLANLGINIEGEASVDNLFKLKITGPSDVWFAFGLNATTMSNAKDKKAFIHIPGIGLQIRTFTGFRSTPSLQQTLQVNTPEDGITLKKIDNIGGETVIDLEIDDVDILQLNSSGKVNIVAAKGTNATLAQHTSVNHSKSGEAFLTFKKE